MTGAEFRNDARRELRCRFEVIDSMTGLRVGHLIDLSATGLQAASDAPLTLDALYQWRFTLPEAAGEAPLEIECGVQVVWVGSPTPGQHTAGARFIQLSRPFRDRIRTWCAGHSASGGH